MHRVLIGCVALAMILTATACDKGSNTRKFGGRTWSASLSKNDEALERAIVADIMGGIVASVIQPDEMSLSGIARLGDTDASKLSISVPLERAATDVADAYVYESPLGAGALTIQVNGSVEEINTHTEGSRKLRFYPLELTFSFENYAYTNSCGLDAVVTGNVSCRMQGDLTRSSGIIDAMGSCTTGTEGMTGTVLYQLDEEEYHDVFIQATVRAGGPWYELTSYQFYGTYMLDRRSGTLDAIIAKPPMVCEY